MVDLNPEQTRMLREILTDYLSDLRMEIADTDSMDFREDLKRRRIRPEARRTALGRTAGRALSGSYRNANCIRQFLPAPGGLRSARFVLGSCIRVSREVP